jgi:hypothetical protein
LSTILVKDQGFGKHWNMGKVIEIGNKGAQFRAAEKNDEGMALKIRTRAEDMPDGHKNLFVYLSD